jgi:hypothetical protein
MDKEKPQFDIASARKTLSEKQIKKLKLAAKMLKETAKFWDGDNSMLPHWAAGIITHGQPKGKYFEVGKTEAAENAQKQDITHDHLYRVTATAKHILSLVKARDNLTIEEIENILLQRSLTMITTRSQNNSDLKKAIKSCSNKDDWKELYEKARIKYKLFDPTDATS